MKTRWSIPVLLFVLLLSACDRLGGSQATSAPREAEDKTGCPAVTEGTQLLLNEAHGYCLLYPVGYEVRYPNDSEAILHLFWFVLALFFPSAQKAFQQGDTSPTLGEHRSC